MLYDDEQVKDVFYEILNHIVSRLPEHDHFVILGNFNATVGADHEFWITCLAQFGFGKNNSDGQRL